MQLGKNTKITCGDVTASAATPVDGSVIDMGGYEGATIVVKFNIPAANNTVKIQGGEMSDLSDAADLQDAEVSGDGVATTIIVDVHKPTAGFIRPVITRGTAAAIQSITVFQYCGRTKPVRNGDDADNVFAAFVSPNDPGASIPS